MVNQNKTLEQNYDLFAVRIIVDSIKTAMQHWESFMRCTSPIPGRFKDYIAMPKPNMYQSLHTTLIGPKGQPFEIQIRTYEMHRTAEYGIAAHWNIRKVKMEKGTQVQRRRKTDLLRQVLNGNWIYQIIKSFKFN